ncbi:MAG: hypothetical protein RLZZ450_701 [Pseudomonadota bacterium]
MDERDLIREALRNMPAAAAHVAADSPAADAVYAPLHHGAALRVDRSLVVGNRGVGKSFWASVLASDQARERAADLYKLDELRHVQVSLGFHESAGITVGPAPSPEQLGQLRAQAYTGQQIWKAVLLRALGPLSGRVLPASLADTMRWSTANIEEMEAALRHADATLLSANQRFLLVFDALDRLAPEWAAVRELSNGVLRFALDVRGFRAIRAKVFLRADQWHDEVLFRFADASKLRSERVELTWTQCDLYGLVYQYLWDHPTAARAFQLLVNRVEAAVGGSPSFVTRDLRESDSFQEGVFCELAGEFMGSNPRRGRTYNWLHDHLADALGQTSPRSFQIALRAAALAASNDLPRVLDHLSIKAGVQAASDKRVEQLTEDYAWIRIALEDLAELEVPASPDTFERRWRERETVKRICELAQTREVDAPVTFALPAIPSEQGILQSLKSLGVIEERAESRINVPDIFRVAAKLKRRGGVRVPPPTARRG